MYISFITVVGLICIETRVPDVNHRYSGSKKKNNRQVSNSYFQIDIIIIYVSVLIILLFFLLCYKYHKTP